MQKNQKFEVEITDVNNLGYGVCKIDGMVVFVNGGVTGDKCTIKIIKVLKSYAIAICEEIHLPSSHRTSPSCKYKRCGGCVFHNISFDYENQLKKEYIESVIMKSALSGITVENTIYAENGTKGYRNKAQYPFSRDKNGKICAGFFASHSHEVIPCDFCYIAPEIFSDIIKKLIVFFEENSFSVYDEKTGYGLLRHLYLRIGEKTGQIMLCLVINGEEIPKKDAFISYINDSFPEITSVFLNINKQNTNVVLSNQMKNIYGKPYIEDILCGKRFSISPLSFYQVNHDCTELLYNKAKELLGNGNKKVIDLYCGIGTVGMCIADGCEKLIGVEIIPDAIKDAKSNAMLNNLSNCEFYTGDASIIGEITDTADAIIVDPPRKGLSGDVINYIASSKTPKVIYISCSPETLVRDISLFRERGYTTDTIYPVNMFPRTQHVESVVCLRRTNR